MRPTTRARLLASVGLAGSLPACTAGGNDDGFNFATDSNGPGGATGSSSGSGGDSTAAVTDAETDPAATVATGADTDASGSTTEELPPAEPCTAVDILFVVDNSQPMLEEQIRLRASAVAFVQQLQTTIPTLTGDLNIGVITTDDDLMVQSTAEPCGPYEGGNHWMISSSTSLGPELECALNVGVAGSPDERPMEMLIGSLADENLVPGGFHNGFLREEALLVVVVVTNEEDEFEIDTEWGSMGDPASWVEAMAGRKGGWVNDVVVLSLVGVPAPNACLGPWDGTEGAQVAPRLIEFTESFPQGAVGDVCEQEYASFLLGVVPGVAAACAAYVSP